VPKSLLNSEDCVRLTTNAQSWVVFLAFV